MTLPILTERLILRSFTYNDIQDIIEIVSHPSVARITTNIEANESKVRKYIDKQKSYRPFEKDKYYDLAMERKEDGKVIGLLGLMREDHKQGLIGWALGVDYRGNGYVTEGARSLIMYGFTELDLHRIYAKTSSINTASWKVMERVGMRKEAHLREAEFRDGEWIDVLIYAILADEGLSQDALKKQSENMHAGEKVANPVCSRPRFARRGTQREKPRLVIVKAASWAKTLGGTSTPTLQVEE
jgi:RimJ/RimL family protein N-acetyltransferase